MLPPHIQGDTGTNYGADRSPSVLLGHWIGRQGSRQWQPHHSFRLAIPAWSRAMVVLTASSSNFTGVAIEVSVGGGTGADTINVAGTLGVVSGQIFGGGDADSIYAGSVASGIDASLVSIYGGAGADTITISGQADIASGSQFATLAYSSLSESTLGSVDLFQVVSGTTSGAANGNISGSISMDVAFGGNAVLSAISTGFATLRAGNATSFTTIDANGVATWEGALSGQVSSLTAAVEQIDKTVISKDHAAVFATGGGTEYLFIQGGTAGTSDDLIVQFGGLSATNLTDAGSQSR